LAIVVEQWIDGSVQAASRSRREAAVQDGLKDLASVLVEDIKEAGQGTRGLTAPEQFRSVKGFYLLHRSLLPLSNFEGHLKL
jgi:hypothetical protein